MNTSTLIESRVQLHYAIQSIAAISAVLAPPQPDFSHTALTWHPSSSSFMGTEIHASQTFRVGLEPVSLTASIYGEGDRQLASRSLHNMTTAEVLQWHKQEIAKLGADTEQIVLLDYPPDDFPDHPLARGARFDASQTTGRQELASYFAQTHHLLQAIVVGTVGASPIRIWPHHFDMATLISLAERENGEARSIGVGFSPGDASIDQPYWYVTPWPYPETADLPALAGGGSWHTSGWVGALLRRSQLDPATEAEEITQFLQSALHHAKALLEGKS